MSNDDGWSGAGKLPPMVYVPPPDADGPTGRGGIIGFVVLLVTVVCMVVAGVFSIQNWVSSKTLASFESWSAFELDGGIRATLMKQKEVTDLANDPALEQFRVELLAQNRAMCANVRLRPTAVLTETRALPDLQRQVDDSRRAYDRECRDQGRSANCTPTLPADPNITITAAQRDAICAQYTPPKPPTQQP